ncbi:MAG: hypothetical protein AAF748_15980 [Pseudomonadota bacterium]
MVKWIASVALLAGFVYVAIYFGDSDTLVADFEYSPTLDSPDQDQVSAPPGLAAADQVLICRGAIAHVSGAAVEAITGTLTEAGYVVAQYRAEDGALWRRACRFDETRVSLAFVLDEGGVSVWRSPAQDGDITYTLEADSVTVTRVSPGIDPQILTLARGSD